jgi:hypothetical protein
MVIDQATGKILALKIPFAPVPSDANEQALIAQLSRGSAAVAIVAIDLARDSDPANCGIIVNAFEWKNAGTGDYCLRSNPLSRIATAALRVTGNELRIRQTPLPHLAALTR